MTISVLTPDRTIFTGTITRVTLPGTNGSFQLMNNHAPLVSSLTRGKITLEPAGEAYQIYDEKSGESVEKSGSAPLTFTIEKGFVEVLNNEVNLLVQGATHPN